MEKQLGWCSIEQSEKLIEAGLDPNTADMFYTSLDMHETPWVWNSKPFLHPSDVPCWSLGRLIELMPDTISIGLKTYCLWINNKSCGYYRMKENLPTSGDCLCNYFKYNNSNPIFDCMLFLLENNYIKKGKTK